MTQTIIKIPLLILTFPLSMLWSLIYRIRRFFYGFGIFKSHSFYVPIISVGNLTFGGTGKTPFTLWLANFLGAKDKRVMILTRGYKGALEHKSGILHSQKRLGFNPYKYGDEATMLIRKLHNAVVVVGKRRAQNLDYYFEEEDPDAVLLDDGHQHLNLKRDLNIVLFDALLPMDRYKVAPSGYLREGLSALKDADIVILGRADQVKEDRLDSLKDMLSHHMSSGVPFVEMYYKPTAFKNASFEQVFSLEDIKDKSVICVAGIASPKSFFEIIKKLGANIIDHVIFPDHHKFNTMEINELLERAEENDALVVTTEKDIVKIGRIVDDARIVHLEIEVDFLDGRDKLISVIENTVNV